MQHSTMEGSSSIVEDEDRIIVDYKEAFDWKEELPSQLRQNLYHSLQERLSHFPGKETETKLGWLFNQFKLAILQDKALEVDVRFNNVSYSTSKCPFQSYTLRPSENGPNIQLPLMELRHEHIVFSVNSLTSKAGSSAPLVIRAYHMPAESGQRCRQLLRFVAACTMRASSVSPFVLAVLRIYESPKYTHHVFSRAAYGSIADIMRTLHIMKAGGNSQDKEKMIGIALPHQYTLYFSACIQQALQFMSEEGISLNRLSTETVVVTDLQTPMLADFLYATRCSPEERHNLIRRVPETPQGSGSDSWLAPEILAIGIRRTYQGRVDVWNIGTFVLMMSVGTEGFKHVKENYFDHRTLVGQTSIAVAMQPCSQLEANRTCSIAACSSDLIHLLSVTLADHPEKRPTLRMLQSLSYFARVNFLNLHNQVGAYGINLEQLLGRSPTGGQQRQQALSPAGPEAGRRTPQAKQLQMLEQLNDVDELLSRMGLQAVTVVETCAGQ